MEVGSMRLMKTKGCVVAGAFWISVTVSADTGPKESVEYLKPHRDSALEKIKEKNRDRDAAIQRETEKIREDQAKRRRQEGERKNRLHVGGSSLEVPASVEDFKKSAYFPPVRQFLTGTCWSFSTTSFFESEVMRLQGKRIKLSEMYTVYHEYLEKARRFVRERGKSFFGETSEGNAVLRLWPHYGIVPAEAYRGVVAPEGRYDHSEIVPRMHRFLKTMQRAEHWDEDLALDAMRLFMDPIMGRPPNHFVFQGKRYTPVEFLKNVLKLKLDDYVAVMSTLSKPFFTFGEYEVEGNWWRSRDYYNVPLDMFYQIIQYAVQNGYTVRINGDVSEPGHDGRRDVAYIPSIDIPVNLIDQSSRELRIYNRTTDDDHDTHLVGWTRKAGFDWFLIKDSQATAFHGNHKGYFFYREDYIKLKMLTYIVHRDVIEAVVKNFKMSRSS